MELEKIVASFTEHLLSLLKTLDERAKLEKKVDELMNEMITLPAVEITVEKELRINKPVKLPKPFNILSDTDTVEVTSVLVRPLRGFVVGIKKSQKGGWQSYTYVIDKRGGLLRDFIYSAVILHLLKEQHGIDAIEELKREVEEESEELNRFLETLKRIFAIIRIATHH